MILSNLMSTETGDFECGELQPHPRKGGCSRTYSVQDPAVCSLELTLKV